MIPPHEDMINYSWTGPYHKPGQPLRQVSIGAVIGIKQWRPLMEIRLRHILRL